jgi:hypothetical protein
MKSNLKKTIAVVILAVLTLSAFSTLLSPSVRAQSSEVKVLSYSWYVAPSTTVIAVYPGDLVAVGEIQNVGSSVIGSIAAMGYAFNSTSAAPLDSSEVSVFMYTLLPGQKAPFYIDFIPENSITGDQSWVPSVTNVSIVISSVTNTNATQYSGLTSTVSSASNVDGTYTVTGTVHNTGSETADNVFVDATFYNSSGSVVGMDFTGFLSTSLSPGTSVPFTATPTDNPAELSNGAITSYSLLVQSESATPPASPSPSPSTSTLPTSSPTVSPTASASVKSSGSSGLIYAAVGTAVIVIVAVTALAFQRKRHNLPPPPPPPAPSDNLPPPPPPSG